MDFAVARERMVQEQLVKRGIRDRRVLAALRSVERHRFVDSGYEAHAYEDMPLPIGGDQTISQPYMVALMTETAALTGSERVLEIGTGSGYQTALLCMLAGEVYSVERIDSLSIRASEILSTIGFASFHLQVADGSEGWREEAPFDVILITAATPGIPRPLLEQLAPDGRLIAPIGEEELQSLVRIRRDRTGWREEYFGECRFVKMVGRHGFESG